MRTGIFINWHEQLWGGIEKLQIRGVHSQTQEDTKEREVQKPKTEKAAYSRQFTNAEERKRGGELCKIC